MSAYLEHANITVPDVHAAIAFLKAVEPEFRVRHDGTAESGYRWAHVGTDDCYVALEEPHSGPDSDAKNPRRPYHDAGVNHLAWVVEDLDTVIHRLEQEGYRRGIPVEPHPHRKRVYFFNSADFEWEMVEYLSADPAQRHSYG